MPAFQPRVCYQDCSAAVDWPEGAFGFQPTMVATREGQVVSAELSFGGARLTVGGAWENIKPPAMLEGANTQIIHVVVDSGLDAHCERTYRALDPQGHMWIFGQKLRDVTNEEMEAAVPGMKISKRI